MTKNQFHTSGKKLLKTLAEKLELAPGSFDVRSNKGGSAVLGEVVLHSESLYVMIGAMDDATRTMYRSCKGRKDYCGGQNCYMPTNKLLTSGGLHCLCIAGSLPNVANLIN